MARKQLTNLDFDNVSKAVNLPNPTDAQDAATKAYVDSSVEGLAWKDAVHVDTSSNINLTSAPATINGQGSLTGKRILVKDQSTPAENGIYVHNGSGQPMTRALDANTAAELDAWWSPYLSARMQEHRSGRRPLIRSLDRRPSTGRRSGRRHLRPRIYPGIAEIATQGETDTGTDDARFITPLKLATWAAVSANTRQPSAMARRHSTTSLTASGRVTSSPRSGEWPRLTMRSTAISRQLISTRFGCGFRPLRLRTSSE